MKQTTRMLGALAERALSSTGSGNHRHLDGLTVLGYHRIDDSGGHLSVRISDFRAHLDWIKESGAKVTDMTAPEVPSSGQEPRVAITFDDGYVSVAEAAWPELRARGLPATLYVVPGYLDGRSFPWDEGTEAARSSLLDKNGVRELAGDGMTIGSHTVSHRYLPSLTTAEANEEIVASRHMLQDIIELDVTTFSYPMGGWNDSLRNLVAEAGYSTAVTTRRGRNRSGQDPLALRRPIVESDPSDFVKIMQGDYDFLRPVDYLRELWRQKRCTSARVKATTPP